MVKAVLQRKNFPNQPIWGFFLSPKPFLPRLRVLRLLQKPSLKGGYCIIQQ